MYDYRPPRKNATAKIVVLLLFLASAAAFVGAATIPVAPIILQSIGLALLIPIAQISARYLILQYLYRLRSYEDGTMDFEVYSYRGGNRMQLICRIGIEEITAVTPLTKENRKPAAGIKRYSYVPDLSPADALVLSITNEDGDCELLTVPDAYIKEAFETAVNQYHPKEDSSPKS